MRLVNSVSMSGKLSCILLLLSLSLPGLPNAGLALDTPGARPSPHVTIIEFGDFQCPFCARQAPELHRLQAEYAGKVTLVFKNYPLAFHSRARAAHLAALAAKEQGKFWEMHDLLYSHPGHLADADFDQYADQLGLDKTRFHRDIKSETLSAIIESDIAEGQQLEVGGTPTFIIDGRKVTGIQTYAKLKSTVDSLLSGKEVGNAKPLAKPENIEVSLGDAPSLGPASAPTTVVEFGDFQCPYCARAVPKLQGLMAANSGNVRLVFKSFPLAFHTDASLAHMAALAAGEQGKFWEMHDLIYSHQRTIKRYDLIGFASQLKLDLTRFRRDLDSPSLRNRILVDKAEGSKLGITGTPTFIVNGVMISGFSAKRLQRLIDGHGRNERVQGRASKAAGPGMNLSLGSSDAPIKIDWYADLSSPLTAGSAVELQQFMAQHPKGVYVQFRNFPQPGKEESMLVHEFVLAAAAQGKFWPIESLLLADPKPKNRNELTMLASEGDLDQERLWKEVDARKYEPLILHDLARAKRIGVTGTPTFVIGDKRLEGTNALQSLALK